jgi:ADP-heptose:LPS heptosyltransferase
METQPSHLPPLPRQPETKVGSLRILIRGTNWLGDAVMTTPALLRLREHFQDAHITLLTPEKLNELWLNHPAVNGTISFVPGESVLSVGRKLRAGRFDLALVLPNSPRSAIEVWLAGIPQRIGYARPWRNFFLTNAIAPRSEAVKMRKRSIGEIKVLTRGTGFQPVNHPSTGQRPVPPNSHQIHEYLHLTAALGANPAPLTPQLFVAPDETEVARKKIGLDKIAQPIFGLNAGAEYGPAKRWPVEKFIATAREIQKRTNCLWLILGGKGDLVVANRIESEIQSSKFKTVNLAGQTSLRELMSLLKLCRVLLTNDTGPMHVAAALGTPVVVPFGSTSPELTGPGLPGDPRHRLLKSDVPCSPCFLRECPIDFRCMNGISVERVVEAVLQII